MAKKDKKKNAIQNKEMLLRMNYLYQASTLMSNIKVMEKDSKANEDKQTDLSSLSRIYNSNLKGIARKLVVRIDPSIKRSICKRCHSNLIIGKTCKVELKEPNDTQDKIAHPKLVYSCSFCQFKKSYLQDPNHILFTDKQEHVILN